jgi:predicted double-glycine peptidase
MQNSEAPDSQKKNPARKKRILLVCAAAILLLGVAAGITIYPPPFGSHMNRLPLVRQATPYTCGVASLQSILFYYGDEWREDNLAKELKSDPDQGTNVNEIVRLARARGLAVETRENMSVEELKRLVADGHPVMVALQAWGDRPETYAEDWEDGHYSIVVGYDRGNLYFMDPSTLGNYAFIPIAEFVSRWHDYYLDKDGRRKNLVHLGLIFSGRAGPAYDPAAKMPMK